MRSAETFARGSMMETMVIIKNAMMTCMVYWIKAIISPTCSRPASMLWPPFQTMSSVMPFIKSMSSGIMRDMVRLINRPFFIRAVLA